MNFRSFRWAEPISADEVLPASQERLRRELGTASGGIIALAEALARHRAWLR